MLFLEWFYYISYIQQVHASEKLEKLLLQQTIDEWIEEYERNPDAALVKLQQFFISCCGCKGVINAHMLSTMEYRFFSSLIF